MRRTNVDSCIDPGFIHDGVVKNFKSHQRYYYTVRICTFPSSRLGFQGIGISPDCNPENRATPGQVIQFAGEGMCMQIFSSSFSSSAQLMLMLFPMIFIDVFTLLPMVS
ncbi:hypothetical protein MKX03_012728 [Papaver bracteatum]|nr:hypothetical protein MKX03_012728 [Papaver bracteatum]